MGNLIDSHTSLWGYKFLIPRMVAASPEEVERGIFHRHVSDRMVRFRASQSYAVADSLHHRRTLVGGGTGSGKTTVALAMADLLSKVVDDVVILAPTRERADIIYEMVGMAHVSAQVVSPADLPLSRRSQFMVIDDADLLDWSVSDTLDSIDWSITGGLADGRWSMLAGTSEGSDRHFRIQEIMRDENIEIHARWHLSEFVRGTNDVADWIEGVFPNMYIPACPGVYGSPPRVAYESDLGAVEEQVAAYFAEIRSYAHELPVQAIEVYFDTELGWTSRLRDRYGVPMTDPFHRLESDYAVITMSDDPTQGDEMELRKQIGLAAQLVADSLLVVAHPSYKGILPAPLE